MTVATPPPQLEEMDDRSQLWPRVPLDVPRVLAWLTKPLLPVVDRFGMRIPRRGPRGHQPGDILLPDGYLAEVVATGFSAPVMTTFGPDGAAYVVESGHKVDDPPRVRRVDTVTGEVMTVHELAGNDWIPTGAVTGAAWAGDALILTVTDRLVRIEPDGTRRTIVDGLPGRGDHQVNHPQLGPDGKLYFGVGSATNSGVVGSDNAAYAWLREFPDVHDVPARDIVLAGRNYEDRDVLGDLRRTVRTGAFVPFGVETRPGQVIPGNVKATGAVLRCDPDGGELEVVAWGLRNPYGLAFTGDGRLLATEHGMDSRSARHIIGDYDDLYVIEAGRWYGWPDFASGIPLDDPAWGDGGQGREPVLAQLPEAHPPLPVVSFQPHAGANGLAVAPGAPDGATKLDGAASGFEGQASGMEGQAFAIEGQAPGIDGQGFGFEGQAFVALFGDLAPITTPRLATPVGFKVVRVDLERREIVDFAVNRIQGPASKLPHEGFERPSHCVFGPDGALYVTDFGEIDIAPEKVGIRIQAGTGTLWRIRRTGSGRAGLAPPSPLQVPFYAGQYAVWGLLAGGLIAIATWLIRRILRR